MPKKEKRWAIARDGCWLAYWTYSGIREFIWNRLVDIPTGVYVDDIRYAKPFETRQAAELLARQLGGKVFELTL